MTHQTLSAVVITRNEEAVLSGCLESLSFAGEIVVYDSESTDATQAIAEKHSAKFIIDAVWEGFGRQRQKAQTAAKGDWILMVDADEIVTDAMRREIETILKAPPPETLFRLKRRDLFFGRPLRCAQTAPIRLYPRTYTYRDQQIHESVEPRDGMVRTLRSFMLHDTCRDFDTFQTKRLRYAWDWATERAAAGKRTTLFSAFVHGCFAFWAYWLFRGGFLDGREGLLYARLMSQYTFNKYSALWTLSRSSKVN